MKIKLKTTLPVYQAKSLGLVEGSVHEAVSAVSNLSTRVCWWIYHEDAENGRVGVLRHEAEVEVEK